MNDKSRVFTLTLRNGATCKIDYKVESTQTGKRILWCDKSCDNEVLSKLINIMNQNKLTDEVILTNKRNLAFIVTSGSMENLKEDIVIKKFSTNRLYDRLRFLFLWSKAFRSLKTALALQKAGLNTPAPVASIEERGKLNNLISSIYVTGYISDTYSLKDVVSGKLSSSSQRYTERYLPKLAKDIRLMHDCGIIHNDLHNDNILIRDTGEDFDLFYIDLNRARIKKRVTGKQRLKDLAGLGLSREQQEILVEHYTMEKREDLLEKVIKAREKKKNRWRLKKRLRKKLFNK